MKTTMTIYSKMHRMKRRLFPFSQLTSMILLMLYLFNFFCQALISFSHARNGDWSYTVFPLSFYTSALIFLPCLIFAIALNLRQYKDIICNYGTKFIVIWITLLLYLLLNIIEFAKIPIYLSIFILACPPVLALLICKFEFMADGNNYFPSSHSDTESIEKLSKVKTAIKILSEVVYFLALMAIITALNVFSMGKFFLIFPFFPIGATWHWMDFMIFLVLIALCIYCSTFLYYVFKLRACPKGIFGLQFFWKHLTKITSSVIGRIAVVAAIMLVCSLVQVLVSQPNVPCVDEMAHQSFHSYELSGPPHDQSYFASLSHPSGELNSFLAQITDYSSLKSTIIPFLISTFIAIATIRSFSKKFAILYLICIVAAIGCLYYLTNSVFDKYSTLMTVWGTNETKIMFTPDAKEHILNQLIALSYAWPHLLSAFSLSNALLSLHFLFKKKYRHHIYKKIYFGLKYIISIFTIKEVLINPSEKQIE